ncbi:MAG: amidase [Geminicoccaceae bacterium]|nr:amidase [Geminicoccaceae bacterium]MDW8370878.1 amidase [Geminicoccaceae bacterium]
MTAIHDLGAAELAAAYRRRELSPVEATAAALARIEACEPALNAMYLVAAERALDEARESEARYREGRPISPLDGVPVTIKDNIATAGTPTPFGTRASDTSVICGVDSPPAARLREAGCVFLGKTTMPDFGMLASGVSSFHGTTRNPWNPARNTSGSSSGAGAAVAAGYGPLALGTDIGGSVRLPAAWCGIFALKPSLGRVPIDPPFLGRVTGPMTRTVDDAALLLDELKKPDARDFMALPPEPLPFAPRLQREPRGVRLGLLLDIGAGLPVDPEIRAAIEDAARRFEAAGCILEPVEPFLEADLFRALDLFFRARLAAQLLDLPSERLAGVLPFVRDWALGAVRASAIEGARALAKLFEMRRRCQEVASRFDYLLTPTLPIPPFAAEDACPNNDLDQPFSHICFTAPFNQSEQPACSICCGYTGDGLPIGLQIVGRRFDDLGVLQMARLFERIRAPLRPWPMG